MSFRRDKEKASRWREWLGRNRDELIAICGVPYEIVTDQDRWWYLEHHGDDHLTGWNIEMLNDEQARRLRDLVWRELGERGYLYRDIDRMLEQRHSSESET